MCVGGGGNFELQRYFYYTNRGGPGRQYALLRHQVVYEVAAAGFLSRYQIGSLPYV